ncbi:MAG: DNA-3-methyladenine glycosylase I [Propionibacteriaceae bacterium]|nr:DNA-3-methyladenine glycosylase I [Propionibacteriaceae bacterium]
MTIDSATALCFGAHAGNDPSYAHYHDTEWGRPVHDETAVFERICLESFQVGLSWRTILNKREAFREVFLGFDPARVARFTDDDVERLLGDPRIVRNRGKIRATITAARIVDQMHADGQSLAEFLWSYQPAVHVRPTVESRASSSVESSQAAAELRKRGFRFVGPVNVYASMQACGLVNDHVIGCVIGDQIERLGSPR